MKPMIATMRVSCIDTKNNTVSGYMLRKQGDMMIVNVSIGGLSPKAIKEINIDDKITITIEVEATA